MSDVTTLVLSITSDQIKKLESCHGLGLVQSQLQMQRSANTLPLFC